jgi:hypothetical protein
VQQFLYLIPSRITRILLDDLKTYLAELPMVGKMLDADTDR